MDAETLDLFERSLRHATGQHTGDALDQALAELGWRDALADDPQAAVSTLFALQGAANVTSSALDDVVVHGLGLVRDTTNGVVLPPIGGWDPPGRLDGRTLQVRGLATAGLAGWAWATVVANAGPEIVVLTLPAASLELAPVAGMDPSLGLVQVLGVDVAAATEPVVVTDEWGPALAGARLAVAIELVGASRTMLELARTHALDRIQFGRPISSFQAVRHRLAETLVAIEMAEAVIEAAWLDGSPDTAAMAKAVAGRQARTVARHSQQVLAGIGFTTEHPLHHHIKRTLVLDGLFGSSTALTRALGDQVMTSGQLPPLLPL